MEKQVINNQLSSWRGMYKGLVQYRSLLLTLVRRDLKIRYSQTVLGIFWVLFQPLVILVIFTLFFRGILQLETQNIPYPVYTFSGIILWYYFTGIVGQASNVMLQHEDLIRKVYFPKLILILAKVLVSSVDFIVGFVFFLLLLLFYGHLPPWTIIFSPLILIILIFFAVGIALVVSSLSIRRRDLLHILPTALNFAIWLTPVFYPATIVPQPYLDWMHYLNPVATIIELFRWCMLGTPMDWMHCVSFAGVFLLLFVGLSLFRKAENKIADYV